MQRVTVPLRDRRYEIFIGAGLLQRVGEIVGEAGLGGRVALVFDAGIPSQYVGTVQDSLRSSGMSVAPVAVAPGERSKSLRNLGDLYESFYAAGLDRKSTVIALGGGVVGDLAGFAAASYLRGIALVQVPTTLLAQVDSSVGGKTGIDLPGGKNLVGAFHQPAAVIADLESLKTLPRREWCAGLAEVIKYGVISDPSLLEYLQSNRDLVLAHESGALAHVVRRSCEIKAAVVGEDERESGPRAFLNYGHTVGHAVEAVAGYGTYLHGEGVSVGMIAAGWLSGRVLGFPAAEQLQVKTLLQEFSLPVSLNTPLDRGALFSAMRHDKKALGSRLRFVLARKLGNVEVCSVDEPDVNAALDAIAA